MTRTTPVVGIPVHDNTYTTWGQKTYFDQLLQKVGAAPEVVRRAFDQTPPRQTAAGNSASRFRQPMAEHSERGINFISSEYFTVLHHPAAQENLDESETDARSKLPELINPGPQIFSERDAIAAELRVTELNRRASIFTRSSRERSWFQWWYVGILANDGLRNSYQPRVFSVTIRMPVWTQIGEPGSRRSPCSALCAKRFMLLILTS